MRNGCNIIHLISFEKRGGFLCNRRTRGRTEMAGEASAVWKLSTATSILARAGQLWPTNSSTCTACDRRDGGEGDDETSEEERALNSEGGKMSAEHRRRSAPNTDAAATAAVISKGAALLGAEAKPLRVTSAVGLPRPEVGFWAPLFMDVLEIGPKSSDWSRTNYEPLQLTGLAFL
jgi:hypothetical protein